MYQIGDKVKIAMIDAKSGKPFLHRLGVIDGINKGEYLSYHVNFVDMELRAQAHNLWWHQHNLNFTDAEGEDEPLEINSSRSRSKIKNLLYPDILQSILLTFDLLLLQIVVSGVMYGVYSIFASNPSDSDIPGAFYILIPITYAVVFKYSSKKNGISLRRMLKGPKVSFGFVALSIITLVGWWCTLYPVLNFIAGASSIVSESAKELSNDLQQLSISWIGFFYVILIGPIVEELFFRGVILRGLLKHCKVNLAVLLSSLLFGIMHMQLVQTSYATFFGIILALVYVKSGSLKLCILLHILNNTFCQLGAWLAANSNIYLLIAFDLLVFIPFIVYLFKRPDRFHLV